MLLFAEKDWPLPVKFDRRGGKKSTTPTVIQFDLQIEAKCAKLLRVNSKNNLEMMQDEIESKGAVMLSLEQKKVIFAHFRQENYIASMRLEGLPVEFLQKKMALTLGVSSKFKLRGSVRKEMVEHKKVKGGLRLRKGRSLRQAGKRFATRAKKAA